MNETPNAPPSIDPANDDSLLGMANLILRKHLQSVDDMLPARVVQFTRSTDGGPDIVTLAPMVALLTTAGAQVARAQVSDVPVFRFGGGGMLISFNLKPGDFGWMKANDRDISMFLQSGAGGPPNTLRMHTFEDSMFYPDAMRNVEYDPEDEENAVFQTLDGKYRVAIWPDRVKVTGDDTSAEFKTGEITLVAPTAVTVQSPQINLNGNVSSNGGAGTPNITLTASVSINLNAPSVKIQGREFLGHNHNNVTPGAGNSGGVN